MSGYSSIQKIMLIGGDDTSQFICLKALNKYFQLGKWQCFTSVKQALDYLEILVINQEIFPARQPDIIFLDLRNPPMDNLEFFKHFDIINNNMEHKIKEIVIIDSPFPINLEKHNGYSFRIKRAYVPLKKEQLLMLDLPLRSKNTTIKWELE